MRYLGGKSRISKDISSYINSVIGDKTFVSLFCGSCSIESKVNATTKILNDSQPYLIAMWKDVQNGRTFSNKINFSEYQYVKSHKDEDMGLAGYVGFACSYSGKWFGGLARNKRGEDFCANAERSIYRDAIGLQNAIFLCKDYKDVEIPDNSLVYLDPPYANTTGYSGCQFNTDEFWDYVREISKNNIVLISEENAPEDFECVWSKQIARQVDCRQDRFYRTEKLFCKKT